MSLIAFAIGIMLLMLAWAAAGKTALDWVRDELFDLRDEVRRRFLESGSGLDHPLYRELRDHLNRYIRFAENLRFVGMALFFARLPEDLRRELEERINSRYRCADPVLSEYAREIRARSAAAMQKYLLATSTTVSLMLLVSAPAFIVRVVHGEIRSILGGLKKILDENHCTRPLAIEVAASCQA